MAIHITISNPAAFLKSIKKAIDDKKIDTWEYDAEGDFTHTPEQWHKKAWLRPYVKEGVLQFGLLGPNGVSMKKYIYGAYHGRFIEMLLTHFDNDFNSVSATAQMVTGIDNFQAN